MGKPCNDCGLGQVCRDDDLTNQVMGEGEESTGIMFIGDIVGKYDCVMDEPFSGSVGMLLSECIQKAGYKRRDVYVTNLLKCAIPNKKRNPKKEEIDACSKYLDEEISRIRPKVIVPLGAVATKYFLGAKKISDVRGYVFEMGFESKGEEKFTSFIIPTYSPKSLVARPSNLFELQSDIKKSFRVLEDGNVQIDRDYEFTRDFKKVYDLIKTKDLYAWDIETTGLDMFEDDAVTCSFSWEAGKAICIPFNLEWWNKIFSLGVRNGSHTKFDPEFLECRYGIKVKNWYFDTFAAIGLLNDNIAQGLKTLASVYTDVPYYNLDTKIGLDKMDIEEVAKYNNFDADVTFRLWEKFKVDLTIEGYDELFYKTTMPVNRMLIDIEVEGIPIDVPKLKRLTIQRNLSCIKMSKELNDVSPINWNSVVQVREVLYGKLGLNTKNKTPTGAKSTDMATLTELAKTHRVPQLILDLRSHMKGLGTYLLGVEEIETKVPKAVPKENHMEYKLIQTEMKLLGYLEDLSTYQPEITTGLFKQMNVLTNKIHNQNKITGTVSGRLTSPLHTIPRDGGFRDCYYAPKGWIYVGMDYKQFELRIAAFLAKEEDLITILMDRNVKQWLTKLIIDMDYDEDTWSAVKGVIYGTLYGRGAKSIAEEFGIEEDFARKLLNSFFKNFKNIRKLLAGYKAEALGTGQIVDMVGRKRRFITKQYKIFDVDQDIVRQAVNFPIQAGSSAIFWPQVLKLHEHLRPYQSKVIHTKHDAVYFLIKEEERFLIEECKDIMEKDTLMGDTQVDVKEGRHWGEC
jgi:DNA polymerase-1